MTDTVDESYFQELAGKDPSDICKVSLCNYDPSNDVYLLTVWGEEFIIDPRNSSIVRKGVGHSEVNVLLGLFTFDKTIAEQLPPDVIFSLSFEICRRIGERVSA